MPILTVMPQKPPQPHHLLSLARNPEIPLGALRATAQLREMLAEWESSAIASAREKGATWRDIADALGVTRQALQQRVSRRQGAAPSDGR